MEHIAEYHGGAIGLTTVRVLHRITNGEIEIPETAEQFWAFPKKQGWGFVNGSTLKPEYRPRCELAVLLQAWLFFGLCLTIIQKDSKPILTKEQLLDDNYLSTKALKTALTEWYDWEKKQHEENVDHNGLRFRMIQVACVLDHARQVIRRNCACTGEQNTVRYGVDETEGQLYVEDAHVLVLMCLGEALCEMKAKISRDFSVDMAGWHSVDDQEGWGPPRFVLQEMKIQQWCPRAVRLLKGQFSANATLLVSAFHACKEPSGAAPRHPHKRCTPDECLNRSEDDQQHYCSRHISTNCRCVPFGPDANDILRKLNGDANVIPLLKFRDEEEMNRVSFEVLEIEPNNKDEIDFVAISHVWSDGWGNERGNKLNYCQLKLIQRQIRWATESQHTPFWMDTLIVPVGKDDMEKRARKKAIRQIHSVFNASKWTIVIDNGLMSMQEGKKAETAMKILSSGWTRRLWTLQEGHLSQSIHFVFEERDLKSRSLYGLQEIEQRLEATEHPAASFNKRVETQLSKVILNRHRSRRRTGEGFSIPSSKAAIIVSDAWHAARWRTTSRAEHETLAIATMLGLETEDFEDAGLLSPAENTRGDIWRQELVRDFWKKLHHDQRYRGAIPAGIIFLPGDKINIKGYAWAPKTWLSAHEANYPEPMNFWSSPTELGIDGLLVHYPGFILHTGSAETRNSILGIAAMEAGYCQLSFPVDRTMKEWYSFTKAEEHSYTTFANLRDFTSELAIIVPRLPGELPREIALLVEIQASRSPGDDCGPDAKEYCVRLIRRLYIWRDAVASARVGEMGLKTGNFGTQEPRDFLVAEKLGPQQRWWVDGYVVPSLVPALSTDAKPENAESWTGLASQRIMAVFSRRLRNV